MTALEKWTEDLYQRIGVRKPADISIDYIAKQAQYLGTLSGCQKQGD